MAIGKRLEEQEQRIEELTSEDRRLKELLQQQGQKKGAKMPKFSENYSVEKNKEKRKSKRGQQATGRRPQSTKQLTCSHLQADSQCQLVYYGGL